MDAFPNAILWPLFPAAPKMTDYRLLYGYIGLLKPSKGIEPLRFDRSLLIGLSHWHGYIRRDRDNQRITPTRVPRIDR